MSPGAIGMSLFVEGSHGEVMGTIADRALSDVLMILVLAAVLLYVLAG